MAADNKKEDHVKVLSWNLLLDDLISNFIPRTMKDPDQKLLEEIFKGKGNARAEWQKVKEKLGEEYQHWHKMKEQILDPSGVSQKLRALWSQPDLQKLQGWDLKEQKDQVKDSVTLGDRTTCLGVLQKQLGATHLGPEAGRRIHEAVEMENKHRTWEKRLPKVLERISDSKPDVIAFQEYDMHKLKANGREFGEYMADAGYPGIQLLCPGQERAGIGIFWREECSTDALRNACANGIIEAQSLAEKDSQKELKAKVIGNVDLKEKGEDGKEMKIMDRRSLGFVRLQLRGQPVLFCNTHLMTASRDYSGHVRTEELCTINALMSHMVNPEEAVIFCGDFNINSRGGAHDFIWTKKCAKDVEKKREVKVLEDFNSISISETKIRSKTVGVVEDIDNNGDALIKFEGSDVGGAALEWVSRRDFKKLRSLDHTGYEVEDKERRFIWERADGRELRMRDAYDDIYGSCDASSTTTGMREETIDYVFFDEDLLKLVHKSKLKCKGVMPNEQEPSDHIPLVVEFALPNTEVQLQEGMNRLKHHLSALLLEGEAGRKLAIEVLLPLMQEAVDAGRKQNLRQWLLHGQDRSQEEDEGPSDRKAAMLVRAQSLQHATTPPDRPKKRGEGAGGLDGDFDYKRSTKENYSDLPGKAPVSADAYTDTFRDIRKLCDVEYHGLYTKQRQKWQDDVIMELLKDREKEDHPWLLYTCGPMGVGKSFTLDWLNQQGYMKIKQNMVKIDPDEIKHKMPEYANYDKKLAATQCHRESAYMMEIAQSAAMERNLNVWVDGSLKDAKWYSQQFRKIRSKYRKYRIAIFYIGAAEQTILQRVADRESDPNDGRAVPEKLVRESMASMDKTLNMLTPHCDFVARIINNGPSPVLQAIDSIDHSGIWEGLLARMDENQSLSESVDFPCSLRPLSLQSVSSESLELFKFDGLDFIELSWKRSKASVKAARMQCSPRQRVHLPSTKDSTSDAAIRSALGIHPKAEECCWIYPVEDSAKLPDEFNALKQEENPLAFVLENGGFCYLDDQARIVTLNAIVPMGFSKMQFQIQKEEKGREFELGDVKYWHPVTLEFLKERGAKRFSWLARHEASAKDANKQVGGNFGSFAYDCGDEGIKVFNFIGAGTL